MRLTYAVVFVGQDGYGIQVPFSQLPFGCFSAGDDLWSMGAPGKGSHGAYGLGCAAEDGDLIPEGKMALGDAWPRFVSYSRWKITRLKN